MKFIKFNIVKLEEALVFQILDQNLRKTPKNIDICFEVDGFRVTFGRREEPSLNVNVRGKTVRIISRGTNGNQHLKPIEIYFDSNFDRDKIFNILVKSLKEVSDRYNH